MTTQQNERVELPPLPEGKAVVRGPVSAFNDPESGTLVDFDCEGPLSYDPDDGEELFTADQMREYARAALLAADARAGGEPVALHEKIKYGAQTYGPLLKAAIDLLAAVDARHDQHEPLKYTIPYGAINALRDAINTHPPSAEPAAPVAAKPIGWLLSGHGYSTVFVEQSEPPEPLTREEALAKGWRMVFGQPQSLAAKPEQQCSFPDCKCPMDAGHDPDWCAKGLPHGKPEQQAQAGESGNNKGKSNGRNDKQGPALGANLPLGGSPDASVACSTYSSLSSLTDVLWGSDDVMSLNAELGLTMDQLVRIANVVLQSHREAIAKRDAAQVASCRVGHLTLSRHPLGGIWLRHDNGEGMQTDEDKLYQHLSDYWHREF